MPWRLSGGRSTARVCVSIYVPKRLVSTTPRTREKPSNKPGIVFATIFSSGACITRSWLQYNFNNPRGLSRILTADCCSVMNLSTKSLTPSLSFLELRNTMRISWAMHLAWLCWKFWVVLLDKDRIPLSAKKKRLSYPRQVTKRGELSRWTGQEKVNATATSLLFRSPSSQRPPVARTLVNFYSLLFARATKRCGTVARFDVPRI